MTVYPSTINRFLQIRYVEVSNLRDRMIYGVDYIIEDAWNDLKDEIFAFDWGQQLCFRKYPLVSWLPVVVSSHMNVASLTF